MFKKVLIAEDQEAANMSLRITLERLGIADPKYVFYCDDALTWIKSALKQGQPYDLLITDLSFEEDQPQRISGGEELAREAKAVQPELKVIVFSAEGRPDEVDRLFRECAIDGFVRKARRDAEHLSQAIQVVYQGKCYISPDIKKAGQQRNTYEFSTLDLAIIELLVEGIPQKNFPVYLQERNIRPSSLSSVEKRLNLMREMLGVSNNGQLIAYCKDIGII
ncbi:response regulator [Olivibacter sitiensis]|uniref:response regulator n=1 Tax=Olivibacter sitiensis TaxID=376470 RepID=UPI0003FEF54B|nr:response regulator [Olivibacter sitiensis]